MAEGNDSGYTPPSDAASRAAGLAAELRAVFAEWEAGDRQQVHDQKSASSESASQSGAGEIDGAGDDTSAAEATDATILRDGDSLSGGNLNLGSNPRDPYSVDAPTRMMSEGSRGDELRKPRSAERKRVKAYVKEGGYRMVGVNRKTGEVVLGGTDGRQYIVGKDNRFYVQNERGGWEEVSGADPTRIFAAPASPSFSPAASSPVRPAPQPRSQFAPSITDEPTQLQYQGSSSRSRASYPVGGDVGSGDLTEPGWLSDSQKPITSSLLPDVSGNGQDDLTIADSRPWWGARAAGAVQSAVQARFIPTPSLDARGAHGVTYGPETGSSGSERIRIEPFLPRAEVSNIEGRVARDTDLFPADIEILIDGNRGVAPTENDLHGSHLIADDRLTLQAVFPDGTWRLVDANWRPYLRSSDGTRWQRLTARGNWEGIRNEDLVQELRNTNPTSDRIMAALSIGEFNFNNMRVRNTRDGRQIWDSRNQVWGSPISYDDSRWGDLPIPNYNYRPSMPPRIYVPNPRPEIATPTVSHPAGRALDETSDADTTVSDVSGVDSATQGVPLDEGSTHVSEPIHPDLLSESSINAVVGAINEIAPQFDPQGEEGAVDRLGVIAAFNNFDTTLDALAANHRGDSAEEQRVLEQLGLPPTTEVASISDDVPELFADSIIARLHEARRGSEMTLQEMHQQEVDLIAQRDQISTPGVSENDGWRTLNARIESLQGLERQLNAQFLESAIPGLQRLDTASPVPLLIIAVGQAGRDGNLQPVNDMLEQLAQAIAERSIPYNVPASDDTLVPGKFTAAQLPTADALLTALREFETEHSRDGHYAVNEQAIEGRPFLTLAQPREDLDEVAERHIRDQVLDVLSDRVPALEGEALQELVDRVGQNNQEFSRVLMPFVRAASAGIERDEVGVQAVQRLFAARRNPEDFIAVAREVLQIENIDEPGQEVIQTIQRMLETVAGEDRIWAQAHVYRMLHLVNEYRNTRDSSEPVPLPALALMSFAVDQDRFDDYVSMRYGMRILRNEGRSSVDQVREGIVAGNDLTTANFIQLLNDFDRLFQNIAAHQRSSQQPSQ